MMVMLIGERPGLLRPTVWAYLTFAPKPGLTTPSAIASPTSTARGLVMMKPLSGLRG
jgi:ethanolamine ammonia-lyase small subunit